MSLCFASWGGTSLKNSSSYYKLGHEFVKENTSALKNYFAHGEIESYFILSRATAENFMKISNRGEMS